MRNDVSEPLDRACVGRILPERNMRSHLVMGDGHCQASGAEKSFALDSCVDRSTAISTRVRLFRLFLLIPCWESQRLIPKRSAGPRATKIGVVSLKALDHHRPNREEESAVLPLNYPPTGSSKKALRRTFVAQATLNMVPGVDAVKRPRSRLDPIACDRQVKEAPNRYHAQACDQDRTSLHQPGAQNNDAGCIRDKLWP
jgi:hypothetical protein